MFLVAAFCIEALLFFFELIMLWAKVGMKETIGLSDVLPGLVFLIAAVYLAVLMDKKVVAKEAREALCAWRREKLACGAIADVACERASVGAPVNVTLLMQATERSKQALAKIQREAARHESR